MRIVRSFSLFRAKKQGWGAGKSLAAPAPALAPGFFKAAPAPASVFFYAAAAPAHCLGIENDNNPFIHII